MTVPRPRPPMDVLCEVQEVPDWRDNAEEHRQMARAAIRVALRRCASYRELEAEYRAVQDLERRP